MIFPIFFQSESFASLNYVQFKLLTEKTKPILENIKKRIFFPIDF